MRTKKKDELNSKITAIAESVYYTSDIQSYLTDKVDSTDSYNIKKEIERSIKKGILEFIRLTYPKDKSLKTTIISYQIPDRQLLSVFDKAVSEFPKPIKKLRNSCQKK